MSNKEKFNPCREWIKWLANSCEHQKVKIKKISSKMISSLTDEEFAEIDTYFYHRKVLNLLENYGNKEMTNEEYLEVYQFISTHSLSKLMEANLTIDELNWAKETLQVLEQASPEAVNKKIQEAQDNYQNLAMVDAFILHMIARIDHIRSMEKLEKEIKMRLKENDVMMEKSLNYASNPWNSRG